MANNNNAAVTAIKAAAQKYNIDPAAMIAVARAESGLNPNAVGDGGHAFGLFQFNNAGGVITGQPNPQRYLDPNFNALEAARHIATIKGIHGAKGADAVRLIVNKFERPADPQGEVQRATSYLSGLQGGIPSPRASVTAPNESLAQSNGSGQGNGSSPLQALLQATMLGSTPGHDPGGNDQSGALLPLLMQSGDEQIPTPTGTTAAPPVSSSPPTKANNGIVGAAEKYLGTPYLWGGSTANGLDCSGLVQLAVKQATGKTIPRVASDQYKASTKVPIGKVQPGDIIAFGTTDNVHHIGIYVGNGKFINAPHTGAKVRIDSLSGRNDIVGAGRFPT